MEEIVVSLEDEEIERQENKLVDGKLSDRAQSKWTRLVRQLADYSHARYPDLETALATVSGWKAQELLAAGKRIDDLKQKIQRGSLEGLPERKRALERVAWARFGAVVLFDAEADGETTQGAPVVRQMNDPSACCGRCGNRSVRCACSRRVLCPI